ncbi:cytochrome c family protein [Emticicia sp. BO119]|uniref:c-type cytochrome n=1 Tax=Emticicia sp. BO119 TaxID=2757768 RepID=UPI0015EFF686|nr:c-type cytochrome [Emticicia sp. BO119]MBA4851841.1 c-type cytochrome [Emticicia sp. BO119]
MKKVLLILLLPLIYLSCNQSESSENDSLQVAKPEPILLSSTDSISIDLLELKEKGLLEKTKVITVNEDPVYLKKKRFNAISLKEILENYTSAKKQNPAETKVVFECEDGYKPEMPLEKLLSSKAYLAVSDVDAPKDKEWALVKKSNGEEIKMEPFYVVYEGVSPTDVDYKWPYNLVKIHLAPLHENDAALVPKIESAKAGYELFKSRCQTCHSINKIGGKMGPELNFPKSVTEYWKTEDLKGFIQEPESYRNEVKMPNLGIKPNEAEEIVKYLEYMSKNKID